MVKIQCQKCHCTQTHFFGWKDKEVRENVTVNNKNITLNGKNITVKLTQMWKEILKGGLPGQVRPPKT